MRVNRSSQLAADRSWMAEALSLARRYVYPPYPNPWVGCIVVKNGRIAGHGAHRAAGAPHAEIEALHAAGGQARGSTLYVTLEPCCHVGRTPPCTQSIIRAGAARVVYGIRDPNPEVAGRGAKELRKRGIKVTGGVLTRECEALNEAYLKFRHTGLPFVTVKAATSLDGKIATRTGDSKWITDAEARRQGRALRAQHQAVITGIGTILADDPNLGPRLRGAPDPWRVVLDSKLRTPMSSAVVRSGRAIIATTNFASVARQRSLERRGATVWRFPGSRVPLRALIRRLGRQNIISVMIEAGSNVLGSFFDSGTVDRVCWFISPMVIGSQNAPSAVAGRGAKKIAQAWRLRDATILPAGKSWTVRANLSRWALSNHPV